MFWPCLWLYAHFSPALELICDHNEGCVVFTEDNLYVEQEIYQIMQPFPTSTTINIQSHVYLMTQQLINPLQIL